MTFQVEENVLIFNINTFDSFYTDAVIKYNLFYFFYKGRNPRKSFYSPA